MKEQLQARLDALREEYETDQTMLAEPDAPARDGLAADVSLSG